MSKGSNRRPEDTKAFDSNFDSIFSNKKPVRGSFVFDNVKGELVPKDEYVPQYQPASYVMGDIQPYKSMATGEMIMGRRQHREHLKQHRLYEIGNEKPVQRAPTVDKAGIRKAVIDAVQRHS